MLPTYEQQLDLVKRKLAVVKVNGHLSTFKYSRKVFFEDLWDKEPLTKECRGHTYDNRNGNLVLCPPTKSFNYGERNHWVNKDPNEVITLYKKYNGFMASVAVYDGELVVGTTGTTNSDFAKLAKERILEKQPHLKAIPSMYTYLVEIVDASDPHIVSEPLGVHPLLIRCNGDGNSVPFGDPIRLPLKDIPEYLEDIRHEGFMGYDTQSGVCKFKSPYYIGKKKLMRMKDEEVTQMFKCPSIVQNKLPSLWKKLDICRRIVDTNNLFMWLNLTDQQRRLRIELLEKDYL